MRRGWDPARSRPHKPVAITFDVPMVRSNNPALALEVETFPGQVKKWGLGFLINTEDVEGFRKPDVGWSPQYLLLD